MSMTAARNVDPVQLVIDRLAASGCNPKASRPGQWNAKCPVAAAHRNGDRNPSLSIGTGPDGKALLHCQTGCTTPDVARALDLHLPDLFPDRPTATIGQGKRERAVYPYYDADGELAFEVVRYDPKTFRQRRPDGHGGWTWSLGGLAWRPLYHLPQVRKAITEGKRIWIVEGEKDVENLQWEVDGAVTCNSGGAGKWRPEHTAQILDAKRITIIRDNDDVGLAHVRQVAAELHENGHRDLEVLAPPAGFKDVSEAIGAGKPIDALVVVWDTTFGEAWLRGAEPVADEPDQPAADVPADDEDVESDWTPISLVGIASEIMAGTRQPTLPVSLDVEGAHPLLYAARLNMLFGESGGGKTWLALVAVAETVRRGERVLFLDWEDNPDGITERLVLLGLTLAEIALIDYMNPTTSLTLGLNALERGA